MKPAPFELSSPTSVDELLDVLSQYGDECRVLAGGQSLIPMMNLRLARLDLVVDINRIPSLSKLDETDEGIVVGSTVRMRELEVSEAAYRCLPLLRQAAGLVGHVQIRNRGTVCGSLAHADPAAEMPTAAVALGATMIVQSARGLREEAAESFFQSHFENSLTGDEFLAAAKFPRLAAGRSGTAYEEVSRRQGDFAIVGVATILTLAEDDVITSVSVVLSGVGPRPERARSVESALLGQPCTDAVIADAAAVLDGLEPSSDVHASADYRIRAGRTLVARALRTAASNAREGPKHD